MFDRVGEYTQLRDIRFKAIDASYLRVCKQIYNEGIDLLYGKNRFAFDMTAASVYKNPASYFKHEGQYRPSPRKPVPSSHDDAINRALPQITKRAPMKQLPGWLYYDNFLRFLWFITPSNAASLTTLTFSGIAKRHRCSGVGCAHCEDDLVESLQLYIPFLNRFCTGLKHLTIQATPDHRVGGIRPHLPGRATDDEALLLLLEGSLRDILSLETLKVVDKLNKPIAAAEPTVQWFKDRAVAATATKGLGL